MDIRNIKKNPEEIKGGLYFEAIWRLQIDLLAGYIGKIEKNLPMYPIDIHSYEGQQVLKDMTSRVVEEIAEGYESTGNVLEILSTHGFNIDYLSEEEFDMLLNNLQNSNEEQADAVAFYINLFLYANLDLSDIRAFLIEALGLGKDVLTSDILQDLMDLGYLWCKGNTVHEKHLFKVLDEDILKAHNKDYNQVLSYIPAFHNLSVEAYKKEAVMAWEVTLHLNISRNFLKNKPWKQTQELTDVTRYSKEIIVGFIYYMGYLKAMGFNSKTLYTLFYKKHEVNIFRQQSNY